MDRWSLGLTLLAVMAVLAGYSLEGGNLASLWNGPAALIVFGGGLLATLVQVPSAHLRPFFRLMFCLLVPPRYSLDTLVSKLMATGNTLRREGPVALEKIAASESDAMMRKALMLLADGNDGDSMESALLLELKSRKERDEELVSVLDSLAGYLPTLGIVGAVLGLMQVLSSIKEADALASGIATAFVATFYGVGCANLVIIPLASALRQQLAVRNRYYEAMLAGIVALRRGINPMALRYRLQGIAL